MAPAAASATGWQAPPRLHGADIAFSDTGATAPPGCCVAVTRSAVLSPSATKLWNFQPRICQEGPAPALARRGAPSVQVPSGARLVAAVRSPCRPEPSPLQPSGPDRHTRAAGMAGRGVPFRRPGAVLKRGWRQPPPAAQQRPPCRGLLLRTVRLHLVPRAFGSRPPARLGGHPAVPVVPPGPDSTRCTWPCCCSSWSRSKA